ncbi:MAG: hypothetical protein H0T71_10200 [Acidobacteria bacterium]|nr:hypothetical protein [Acidobacteriota bacterium]
MPTLPTYNAGDYEKAAATARAGGYRNDADLLDHAATLTREVERLKGELRQKHEQLEYPEATAEAVIILTDAAAKVGWPKDIRELTAEEDEAFWTCNRAIDHLKGTPRPRNRGRQR